MLHLDFHPDNIMLTADGPMVFDWPNAALGPPAADVAMAWLIVATSTIEESWWLRAIAGVLRRRFVDRFVDGCGRADARALLADVAAHRLTIATSDPRKPTGSAPSWPRSDPSECLQSIRVLELDFPEV